MSISPLTVAWSMCAAATLMFAIMHAVLWLREPGNAMYAASMLMAMGATINAVCELFLMFSTEIETYALLLKLDNVGIYVMLVSLVWFVYLYFGTGLFWLAATITGLWTIAIAVNFVQPYSIVFTEITELVMVDTYWGETFTLAKGVNSPWVNIPNIASLLILAFLLVSSVRAWRNGDKRRARVVGGGSIVFMLLGGIHAPLVDAGVVLTPYMVSFAFLAIVAAMSYELVSEALLATRYAKEIDAGERRWRSLLDTVPVYVAGLNRDGQIEFANSLLCTVSGYSAEALASLHFTDLLIPEERATSKRIFSDALRHRGTPQVRMSLLSKAGSRRHVVWSTGLVTDAERQVSGMLSIGTDVTERVEAQEKLQRNQREMDRLNRANLLGEVAAGLAHELNQPLTAILSNAQAARRMLSYDNPPLSEIGEIVDDIIADDKRAGNVIHSLRSLLRGGEGVRRTISINACLHLVADLLSGELHAQQISLELDTDKAQPNVLVDQIQIQQVIMNLLLNAINAMSETQTDSRRIVMRSRNENGSVSVSVTDTGSGIDLALLPNLFDAFVTSRSAGLGMGLAICRRIVEAHGGRISAENVASGGAVFTFSIPVGEEELASST